MSESDDDDVFLDKLLAETRDITDPKEAARKVHRLILERVADDHGLSVDELKRYLQAENDE